MEIFKSFSDYYNFSDLHIGVTTSRGVIVEYDKNGIHRTYNKGKNSPWAKSLLVDTISDGWMEHWDAVLDEVCDIAVHFYIFVFCNYSRDKQKKNLITISRLACRKDGRPMNTKRLHIIVTHSY